MMFRSSAETATPEHTFLTRDGLQIESRKGAGVEHDKELKTDVSQVETEIQEQKTDVSQVATVEYDAKEEGDGWEEKKVESDKEKEEKPEESDKKEEVKIKTKENRSSPTPIASSLSLSARYKISKISERARKRVETEPVKGDLTTTLLFAMLCSTIQFGFQFGFNIGCLSSSAEIIEQWMMESHSRLFERGFQKDFIWSVESDNKCEHVPIVSVGFTGIGELRVIFGTCLGWDSTVEVFNRLFVAFWLHTIQQTQNGYC
ncbi:hypothetical protein Aduo_004481 [Ancylostoma duodenale]